MVILVAFTSLEAYNIVKIGRRCWMKDTVKGTIAAAVYAIIIGFPIMLSKVALMVGNPIDLLAHRFTIAFITIFIIALFRQKKKKYFLE